MFEIAGAAAALAAGQVITVRDRSRAMVHRCLVSQSALSAPDPSGGQALAIGAKVRWGKAVWSLLQGNFEEASNSFSFFTA